MIRNGVIDAQREFAERRYRAESDRSFNRIKDDAMVQHGVGIEICRETYVKWQGVLFAVVGDLLVRSSSSAHTIEPWAGAKTRIAERP
jgi:hypothetical protein